MNITINNKSQTVKEPTSIDSLIKQFNIDVKGVAVAVNQTVVPKTNWDQIELKENDNITIITATQGG